MFYFNLKTETPPVSEIMRIVFGTLRAKICTNKPFTRSFATEFMRYSTYPYVRNYSRTGEKISMNSHIQKAYRNLSTRQDFSFALNIIYMGTLHEGLHAFWAISKTATYF
jgi:hypothetical protein